MQNLLMLPWNPKIFKKCYNHGMVIFELNPNQKLFMNNRILGFNSSGYSMSKCPYFYSAYLLSVPFQTGIAVYTYTYSMKVDKLAVHNCL